MFRNYYPTADRIAELNRLMDETDRAFDAAQSPDEQTRLRAQMAELNAEYQKLISGGRR